jgi:rRNA maturation endonuclease Nob1
MKRKNLYDEIFTFKCNRCYNIFKGEIGTPCPKCGTSDVTILVKFKIKNFLMSFFG